MNCRRICYAKESSEENGDQKNEERCLAESLSAFITSVNGGIVWADK